MHETSPARRTERHHAPAMPPVPDDPWPVALPPLLAGPQALLARCLLVLPFLVTLFTDAASSGGPTEFRPGILAAAVFAASTAAGARRLRRRGPFSRRFVTGLATLDFTLIAVATVLAGPPFPAAAVLPAFTAFGILQALLWGKHGAGVGSMLTLTGALSVAVWFGPEQSFPWHVLLFWSGHHLLAIAVAASYAEQQRRDLRAHERRERELAAEAERQAEMAARDPLTGLYNRRALDQRLHEEMARARRTGAPLSLAVIDVDYLKRWNDTHGHAAGDRALQALAGLLAGACRTGDVVCRVGGEEFVLLAPETDAEGLRVLVDRVRAAAGNIALLGPERPAPCRLSFSAGVVQCDPREDAGAFLAAADAALYAAKGSGRARVVVGAYRPPDGEPLAWGGAGKSAPL
jgi:diguanylate cyclase (GGDEF)-like protein